MDDGVESNPGLNINDFRIKEHDTSRVKGRPKKNLHLQEEIKKEVGFCKESDK